MRRRILYAIFFCVVLMVLVGVGVTNYALTLADREFLAESVVPVNMRFNFSRDNACSRLSPAFEITGIPQDTSIVCLSVLDLSIDYEHGGGCILSPPGGSINAGAFPDFRGPCARKAQHLYRFRLTAHDPVVRVIGLAESTVECCQDLLAAEQ